MGHTQKLSSVQFGGDATAGLDFLFQLWRGVKKVVIGLAIAVPIAAVGIGYYAGKSAGEKSGESPSIVPTSIQAPVNPTPASGVIIQLPPTPNTPDAKAAAYDQLIEELQHLNQLNEQGQQGSPKN